jgi:hypothetical protein
MSSVPAPVTIVVERDLAIESVEVLDTLRAEIANLKREADSRMKEMESVRVKFC